MKPRLDVSSGGLALFAVALSLASFAFLSRFLYLAPELSDAGYYILNNRAPDQISNQISMFGIIWFSLFGETLVVTSRLIHGALVFGIGAWLAWSYAGPALFVRRLALSLLAGCGFLTSFIWVLIEPNYNTLALIWLALSLICALPFLSPLQVQSARPSWQLTGAAIGFGAALMLLALTKITSAAAAGLFYVLLYGALHRGAPGLWSAFAKLLAYTCVGFALVLAVLALRGFGPEALWTRLQTGLEMTRLLASHPLSLSGIAVKFIGYLDFLGQAAAAHWGLLILSAILCAMLGLEWALPAYQRPLRAVNIVLALAGSGLVLNHTIAAGQGGHFQVLALLRLSALCLTGYMLWRGAKRDALAWGVFLAAALGPFMLSVGTTNSWGAQFTLYGGLSFAALCIGFARSTAARIEPLLLFIAVLLMGTTGLSMQFHPYRQGATQNNATVPILYGPSAEPLRTSQALAQTYLPLSDIRASVAAQTPRPMLIDATGRAPGVAAYLGLDVPRTAWILSGYPGSDVYFSHVLNGLQAADLRQSWLLVPVLSSRDGPMLSRETLEEHLARAELSLENYEEIAEVYIAYVDMSAVLLRPKTWPKTGPKTP